MSSSHQDRLLLVPPALKRLSPDSSVWNPTSLTSPEAATSWHSSQRTGPHSSSQNPFLHSQEAIPRHLALSERPPRSTIGGVVSQFNLLHVRNRKSPLSCISSALGKLARRLWHQDCRTAQLIEEPTLDWGEVALDDFYVEQTVQEDSADWTSLDGGELAFSQLDECSSNFSDVDLASDANRNFDSPPSLPRHVVVAALKTDDAKLKKDNSDCASSAQRCRKLSWRRYKSLHHLRSRWTVRVQKKLKSARGAAGGCEESVREQSIPFRVERVGDSLEPTLVFSCGQCSPSQRVKATKKLKRKRRVKMVEGVVRRILARRSRAINKYSDLREARGSQGDDSPRQTDSDKQVATPETGSAPLACAGAENHAFSLCDDMKHLSLCACDGAKDSLHVICASAFSPFVYQGSKESHHLANDGTKESLRFSIDCGKDLSPTTTTCDGDTYLTPAIWRRAQDVCPPVIGENAPSFADDVKEMDTKNRKKQLKADSDVTVPEAEISSPHPVTWPTPEFLWVPQSLRSCMSSESTLTFPDTPPRPDMLPDIPPLTFLSSFSPSCSTDISLDIQIGSDLDSGRKNEPKATMQSQLEADVAEESGAGGRVGTVTPGPST